MLYPCIGHYIDKSGLFRFIPAVMGYYDPCPLNAAGSPVWVHGATASAIGFIVAVSPDGRRLTVVGPAGWEATVSYKKVNFLGPTPYRAWVVDQAPAALR